MYLEWGSETAGEDCLLCKYVTWAMLPAEGAAPCRGLHLYPILRELAALSVNGQTLEGHDMS
jgi:hypothetical protein